MSFDYLAPHYDWLEALTAGQSLQRVRTAWLDELQDCRRVLSAGEGHGRFAAAFNRRFPNASLTCLEQSRRMLTRGQARVQGQPYSIEWIRDDILAWQPPERKFDAIVTCFFLDCFPPDQLATVIGKLADCAAPGAKWLVADFTLPARGPARWRAQLVHGLMYGFFRVTTALPARRLTAPDHLLREHGFTLDQRRQFEWNLLQADLWQRR